MILKKLTTILILSTIVSYSFAQGKPDEKAISYLKKYRADYVHSMNEGQPDAVQKYFHEKIRIMPEFQMTIKGRDNALQYYKAFIDRFEILEYERNEIDVLDLKTRIVETGIFKMKIKLKTANQSHEVTGKYQDIWERLSNDKFFLITSVWNHDKRSDIDEQYRFSNVPAINAAFQPRVPVRDNISFELAALNKLSEQSIIEHDDKIWSQFYADDVILAANLGNILYGKKEVEKYLETHVGEMPIFEKLDLRTDQIDHLGDFIIEYASHVANWRAGDASGVSTGKDIRIWKRQSDHSLKMIRQIGSYD
jgi:ketosteroid isomerase-like protein